VSASEKPKKFTTVKNKEISNRVYDPEDTLDIFQHLNLILRGKCC
jgi:hypothetical protein